MTDPIILCKSSGPGVDRVVLRAADGRLRADPEGHRPVELRPSRHDGIAFYTMFFVLNDLGLPLLVALPLAAR